MNILAGFAVEGIVEEHARQSEPCIAMLDVVRRDELVRVKCGCV